MVREVYMPWWGSVLVAVGVAIWGLVSGLLGWITREQWSAIKELRKSISDHQKEVSDNYVRKTDYKDDLDRIFHALERVEDKLDKKLP